MSQALITRFRQRALPRSHPPSYRTTGRTGNSAYDRWTRAIESNPGLGEPFWLRSDIGPAEMRAAVNDLLSFGPNMLPFLVKELRSETDSMRVYRLLLLLNAVAGINRYYDSGAQNVFNGSPQLRDSFIEDWDSGKFLNATQLLRGAWQKGHQDKT
jgi:hypothetical protein